MVVAAPAVENLCGAGKQGRPLEAPCLPLRNKVFDKGLQRTACLLPKI